MGTKHTSELQSRLHLVCRLLLEKKNNGNLQEICSSVIDAFSDGISYFVCFTKSVTYYSVTISYYYDGCEAQSATTFHHFNNTLNGYYAFFQIDFASFYCTDIAYRHILF